MLMRSPDFLHIAWMYILVSLCMFLCGRVCSRQMLWHCLAFMIHVQETLYEQMVVMNAVACSCKFGRLMR